MKLQKITTFTFDALVMAVIFLSGLYFTGKADAAIALCKDTANQKGCTDLDGEAAILAIINDSFVPEAIVKVSPSHLVYWAAGAFLLLCILGVLWFYRAMKAA